MDPHSEYMLTPIEQENDTNFGGEHNRQRVELFINDEYQGEYSLEHNRKDMVRPNGQ